MAFNLNTFEKTSKHRIAYEFVAGDRLNIDRLEKGNLQTAALRYFRCFDMDLNSLAELYCAFKGVPSNGAILEQFEILRQSPDYKRTLIGTPADFCHTFSVSPDMDYADRWTEKTGISISRWQPDFKRKVVVNLSQLSMYAMANQLSIIIRVRML